MIIFKLHKRLNLIFKSLILIFLLVGFTSLVDIMGDIKHHASWHHIWVEISIFSISFISIIILSILVKNTDTVTLPQIRDELNQANSRANEWQQKNQTLVKDLSIKIQAQFIEWNLTKAECEIAFLLLKGFSSKEIASLRNTSERTVREQAIKIYSKANVKNKTELIAFFLEDLLTQNDLH